MHKTEYEQGREDAMNGFPRRLGQTHWYRKGYDYGLSVACGLNPGINPFAEKEKN